MKPSKLLKPLCEVLYAINDLDITYYRLMLKPIPWLGREGYTREKALTDIDYIIGEIDAARNSLLYIQEKKGALEIARTELVNSNNDDLLKYAENVSKKAHELGQTLEPLLDAYRMHDNNAKNVYKKRMRDFGRLAKLDFLDGSFDTRIGQRLKILDEHVANLITIENLATGLIYTKQFSR